MGKAILDDKIISVYSWNTYVLCMPLCRYWINSVYACIFVYLSC